MASEDRSTQKQNLPRPAEAPPADQRREPSAQPAPQGDTAPSPARYRELGDDDPAGNYGSPELPPV